MPNVRIDRSAFLFLCWGLPFLVSIANARLVEPVSVISRTAPAEQAGASDDRGRHGVQDVGASVEPDGERAQP